MERPEEQHLLWEKLRVYIKAKRAKPEDQGPFPLKSPLAGILSYCGLDIEDDAGEPVRIV